MRARCHTVRSFLIAVHLLIIISIIMLHFYRALYLTSQVIQRHTHTSIRVLLLKALLKKKVPMISDNKLKKSIVKINK